MTKEQITHLQDMIDDFMSSAMMDCTIESEGYPHGSYVTSLGISTTDFVHFIDEVNDFIGNSVELSPLLLDTLSFKKRMHNLSHNISEPEVLIHLVESKDVVNQNNEKFVCSVWKHESGRLIQLLKQKLTAGDKEFFRVISCNEVIKKWNNQLKEHYFILKENL